MTEKHKGGFKEFMFLILWLLATAAVYDLTDTFIRTFYNIGSKPGQNLFLTIALIAAGCVWVYLAMRHYAALFTYELTNNSVIIKRKIGRREKNVEIKNRQIRSFSKNRPANGSVHSMKTTVFSVKNTYYLTYSANGTTETIAFEPSAAMAEEISKRVKES